VRPDTPGDGVVGVDTFIGEDAVVEFALTSGLLDANEQSDENDANNEQIDEVSASQIDTTVELSQATIESLLASQNIVDETTTSASQIDTTVALSQSTIDTMFVSQPTLEFVAAPPIDQMQALFGSPTPSEAGDAAASTVLSQAAVARAFDLSLSELLDADDATVQGAQQLRRLSEAC
jgi:hypothetical protein